MVSRTRMIELVKAFDAEAVAAGLAASPGLMSWRDERERNWLHLACATPLARDGRDAQASIRTADALLGLGFGLDDHAFTEGAWRATPLWFAIARGENRPLTEHLLRLGAYPGYCLWAASFLDDPGLVRLLVRHGADPNDPLLPGEPPLCAAVGWSKFRAAQALLEAGADPDYVTPNGASALHAMLRKGSDKAHFAMFVAAGARGDIPDATGQTAIEILKRKRDPDFHRIAEALRTVS